MPLPVLQDVQLSNVTWVNHTSAVIAGKVYTTLNVSRRQCTSPKRLANMDGGSAKNHSLTLVKKNSQAYCKQLAGSTLRA